MYSFFLLCSLHKRINMKTAHTLEQRLRMQYIFHLCKKTRPDIWISDSETRVQKKRKRIPHRQSSHQKPLHFARELAYKKRERGTNQIEIPRIIFREQKKTRDKTTKIHKKMKILLYIISPYIAIESYPRTKCILACILFMGQRK